MEKMAAKEKLTNVTPVLNDDGLKRIAANSVDIAYALDMFHSVDDAGGFLDQMYRILKDTGRRILEDGHQPREKTKNKLTSSEDWSIASDNERYIVFIPKQKTDGR